MILSAHISGIVNNAVSFSWIVITLNSSESNKKYLSASTSTLHVALFELGNLFCVKYRYISLKYGLFKYPTCIPFMVTGRCVPFKTLLCMIFKILSMSVHFGNYFCTRLLVLIKANSGGSINYNFSGL